MKVNFILRMYLVKIRVLLIHKNLFSWSTDRSGRSDSPKDYVVFKEVPSVSL